MIGFKKNSSNSATRILPGEMNIPSYKGRGKSKGKVTTVAIPEKKEVHTKEELESMKALFSIQSSSHEEDRIYDYIIAILDKMTDIDVEEDEHGNILITKGTVAKGEFYPCLAAHMDTVHDIINNYKVIEEKVKGDLVVRSVMDPSNLEVLKYVEKGLHVDFLLESLTPELNDEFWKAEEDGIISVDKGCETIIDIDDKVYYHGGCGDDKGGIWLALDILTKVDTLKVALFSNEEVGMLGSNNVDLSWFTDVGYIIEGDRRNAGDLIHRDICSKDFLDTLESVGKEFGYKSAHGSSTDVFTLARRGVNVSAVNISVGYYNAHSDTEYTVVKELVNARNYTMSLLKELGNKLSYYKKPAPTYGGPYGSSYGSFGSFGGQSSYGGYGTAKYPEYSGYADSDDWYEAYQESKIPCLLHKDDAMDSVVDMWCEDCNPVVDAKQVLMCSSCGHEFVERKYSYECTNCESIKIKL